MLCWAEAGARAATAVSAGCRSQEVGKSYSAVAISPNYGKIEAGCRGGAMAGLASVRSGQAAAALPRRGGAAGRVCGWALSRYRAAPESRSEFTKFMRHYDIMLSTKPSPFQAHPRNPNIQELLLWWLILYEATCSCSSFDNTHHKSTLLYRIDHVQLCVVWL